MEQQHHWNLVFLIGPSGSGKTVIGKRLAPILDYKLVDTDAVIEGQESPMSINDIFEKKGEPYFRSLESQVIEKLLHNSQKAVVATGGGLPAIPNMLNTLKANGLTVYLKAELGTLWARLTAREEEIKKRPLLKKGISALRELLEKREEIYESSDVVLRTDSLSVEEVCGALHGIIMEPEDGTHI